MFLSKHQYFHWFTLCFSFVGDAFVSSRAMKLVIILVPKDNPKAGWFFIVAVFYDHNRAIGCFWNSINLHVDGIRWIISNEASGHIACFIFGLQLVDRRFWIIQTYNKNRHCSETWAEIWKSWKTHTCRPRFTTLYLATIQWHWKNVIYNWSSHLQWLQHQQSHVITIQVLSNHHEFTMVVICDLPSWASDK